MEKAIIGLGASLAFVMVSTMAMARDTSFDRGFVVGLYLGFADCMIPNLTPEQSAQIQALREAFLKESVSVQRDLMAKREEIRDLWSDPYADPTVVKAKQKDVFNLESMFKEEATTFRLDVQKVLTPEQLSQISPFF